MIVVHVGGGAAKAPCLAERDPVVKACSRKLLNFVNCATVCSASVTFKLHVTVSQKTSTASGSTTGACAGAGGSSFTVVANLVSGHHFETKPATACYLARAGTANRAACSTIQLS